jgi:hypothetical protein
VRLTLLVVAWLGVLLGGCMTAQDHASQTGAGGNPTVPGIRLSGNATWSDGVWVVSAEAMNRGSTTYRIDAGCSSPLGLDATADEGTPYQEVQCDAYTEPIPFRPGEKVSRSWTIDAEALGWSGHAHFIVAFRDAGGNEPVLMDLE